MFSDILLTVDFDRTLTDCESRIPRRNIEAIEYFIANGGKFTVNTGRSTATFWQYLDTLPVPAPFLLYTGSAAWYQYLLLTELLGFRKTGSILRFRPVLPAGWDWVRITYRYGSATYHLTGRRDCPFPTADGERLKEGCILLQDDGRIHEAVFPIRA